MKKVMIVDDEFTIRELVELTLSPEYKVIKAESGEDALDKLKFQPDLIVLDIMMPNMDGYEVCRRIREGEHKKVPIIMLTAKHTIDDLKEAIKADVDEYITKPFEPHLLKKSVDSYLSPDAPKTTKKLVQFGKSLHYTKDRE
jgi:DNA-binding response OmpR family regulator